MALSPEEKAKRQRTQGSKGAGAKNASANLGGGNKPVDVALKSTVDRLKANAANVKANLANITPQPQSITPNPVAQANFNAQSQVQKLGGGGVSTGLASDILSSPKISENINNAIASGLSKIGSSKEAASTIIPGGSIKFNGLLNTPDSNTPTSTPIISRRLADEQAFAIKPDVNSPSYSTPSAPSLDNSGDRLSITKDLYRQRGNTFGEAVSTLNLGGGQGKGYIQFKDGRQLTQSQLDSIADQRAFNESEEGRASFARNAELANQRDAVHLAQVRKDRAARTESLNESARYAVAQNNLANLEPSIRDQTERGASERQARSLLRRSRTAKAGLGILENLREGDKNLDARRQGIIDDYNKEGVLKEESKLAQAKINQETLANNITNSINQAKLELDARKYGGEAEFKGLQEENRQTQNTYKLIAEGRKTGQLDPAGAISIFKGTGQTITPDKLGLIFDQSTNETLNQISIPDEYAARLADTKQFTPEEITQLTRLRFRK